MVVLVPSICVFNLAYSDHNEKYARRIIKFTGTSILALSSCVINPFRYCVAGPSTHSINFSRSSKSTLDIHAPVHAMAEICEDPGSLLWSKIKAELMNDESGFKARIVVLDQAIKIVYFNDKRGVGDGTLETFPNITSSMLKQFNDSAPGNGSKFVTAAIMHLTSSPTDIRNKIQIAKHTSHSLDGLELPTTKELAVVKRIGTFEAAYERAISDLELLGTSSVISVSLVDVEIMTHLLSPRTATFPHMFVLTVSPAGVFLYQGYGSIGYTLLQYMERNDTRFPMTHAQGKEFAQSFSQFLRLSVDCGGKWTQAANEIYKSLFEVDLLQMGNIRLNMQFDPYVRVQSHPFTAETVHANFALLPPCNAPKRECLDHQVASGKDKRSISAPNGGVQARYTPVFADYPKPGAPRVHDQCAQCHFRCSESMMVCGRCKSVQYCCKAHQKTHWKAEHKAVCKEV